MNRLIPLLIIISGCIPFGWWCAGQLDADLWYDEIYTLRFFALTSWNTTLADYHLPNNHIFFNLLLQLVSRLTGLRDITDAAQFTILFRSVPLIISLLCCRYIYLTAKKFFGDTGSWFVPLMLFTCIPFLNFSLQLRGYGISMLFAAMMVYYGWSFIAEKTKSSRNWLIFSVFALLYTIPSNLYLVIAFFLPYALLWFLKRKQEDGRHYLRMVIAGAIGLLLAVLCYLPVLKNVISNPYAGNSATDTLISFRLLADVMIHFVSARYLLLLLIVPGFVLVLMTESNDRKQKLVHLFLILLLPFIFSFLHQKNPFERSFVILAPAFALLLAAGAGKIFEMILRRKILFVLGTASTTALCLLTGWKEIGNNDRIIAAELELHNHPLQDMYQNYFLSSVHRPGPSTANAAKKMNPKNYPVLIFNCPDKYAAGLYLEKNKIAHLVFETNAELKQYLDSIKPSSFYLASTFRETSIREMKVLFGYDAQPMDTSYSTVNYLYCTARKPDAAPPLNR